ncbi:cyclin-dependent kinase-like 2 isoform X1 [Dromaius novaehollandiae]|uniref:Cyclin-dependent kinase-like 2 n=1 Tax=Dromaius novaehollandiae TaxID=8790 RepID=A0A8C4J481_DRONO|nr:cyclin-dependent kinase-like 2 isoform X1 [Dromaius novaehollandiae]XP_025976048.1 cyclin-dependent kinase-like 2 isoform X1 [Dromaius novaehollandiae]XP_025976049.1 cyclin-dependent kinase-like 2 isoform X1 [Dromaius novaehollandiae]
MEKYQALGLVGEGSYGVVTKCRNKDSGQIVAVKKFLESEDDAMVKKMALREIKLLKQLRHENLVNLLEVCKKKRRWYLVFEFVDHTVLDDLEAFPNGLDHSRVRKYLFQIIRGIAFCHSHNIIHRDIKPENILVSQSGVVKLCDFGFARTLGASGEAYTDYVATRWYRAPELLVGDIKYGKAVDVWAIGCLVTEMLTGEPLFPGDSDIDQLYHITKCLGNLIPRHQELFYKNPLFAGVRLPEVKDIEPLDRRYPKLSATMLDLAKKCLQIDPDKRPSCAELLQCDFFIKDGFAERFAQELKLKIQKDARDHQLQKKSKISKKDKDDCLGEERKMLAIQDFDIDPKSRDAKLFKVKCSKADAGKAERPSNLSSLYDSAIKPFKIGPQTSLKDSSSSLDYAKNAGIAIPPIIQNLSATTASMRMNAGMGSVPGNHNYRVEEKSKKYLNPFLKQGKHSPAGHYSVSLTSVSNEKTILQANKKKWEFSKTDVRLPELNHLPELRGVEAWNPRLLKKENKTVSESRIPSLAAIDLHNPSLASQQLSGTLISDASEASFPRVEH